jgi:hypothetical protein
MRESTWKTSPEDLGAFDSAIVRCIAGEFSEEFLVRTTRTAGVDVRSRLATLMSKHFKMKYEELNGLGALQRHRLADDIVAAEIEERDTMPGPLVPLRTVGRG